MGNWWNISARRYVVSKQEYDSRCQWEHLTKEEQEAVCDGGCGLTIFGKKVIPDIIFRGCCCHHDFAYLRGGDERVRQLVDGAFWNELRAKVDASEDPAFFKAWAKTYARVVKLVGWAAWDYGPMRTKKQILELAKDG